MRFSLIIFSLFLILSCGSESRSKSKKRDIRQTPPAEPDLKKMDSDGDLRSDYLEKVENTNAYIADIVELDFSQINKFELISHYTDNTYFEFEQKKLKLEDELLAKSKVALTTSNKKVNFINAKNSDFLLKKFNLNIDDKFIASIIEYKTFDNKEFEFFVININLPLTIKQSSFYSEISDLELAIIDLKSGNELATTSLSKTFYRGNTYDLNLEFEINKKNILDKLIMGNSLGIRIKDFGIPQLERSYSELLDSINKKSVGVYVHNQKHGVTKYIATKASGNNFQELLEINNADYEFNNELTSFDGLENNLQKYQNLSELRDVFNQNAWYVGHTDRLTNIKAGSILTLSFLNSQSLAYILKSKEIQINYNVNSKDNAQVNLNNHNNREKFNFYILPKNQFGETLRTFADRYFYRPPNCPNCTGTNWFIEVDYNLNEIINKTEALSYVDAYKALDYFSLSKNNRELNLASLQQDGLLRSTLNDNHQNQILTLELDEIHTKKKRQKFTIKLNPLSEVMITPGFEFIKARSKNINLDKNLAYLAQVLAKRDNLPIATSSFRFKKWQKFVKWNRPHQDGYIPTKSKKRKVTKDQNIDLVIERISYFD